MSDIECGGFTFVHNFDSGNLAKVEYLGRYEVEDEEPFHEFDVWTRSDNGGTIYENGNRTWFYFGIKGGPAQATVKFNIQMNKQSKMYGQGMAPVYRVLPGRGNWERIKERPSFTISCGKFTLTFKHKLGETEKSTVYFAFTYPFSYSDLQNYLSSLEFLYKLKTDVNHPRLDDIYYHRELLCWTLEKKRVDLITISSHHNITTQREPRFENLFPDVTVPRAFRFSKKIIFLSARVHPGETPSSFVMNGIIAFLMCRDDPVAISLRKYYVFKIIPMLNPDGVYRGNYRTDTRGVNLNRVYLHPSPVDHPAIYGARKLILYYHHGREVDDPPPPPPPNPTLPTNSSLNLNAEKNGYLPGIAKLEDGVSDLKLRSNSSAVLDPDDELEEDCDSCGDLINLNKSSMNVNSDQTDEASAALSYHQLITPPENSGMFLYVDMHGHASKKGIFMYGNHFNSMQDNIDCMLLPKLVSINSQHFHFDSCNFTERNMYLRDKKDGSSREGAGRVATLKLIGLIRSYTLECNYNMGKRVNPLPPPVRELLDKNPIQIHITPPKFTPQIFEEVGRSICWAILDLNGLHPNSRLVNSTYRCLLNVREVLKYKVIADANLADGKTEMKKTKGKGKGENSRSRNKGGSKSKNSKPTATASNTSTASKLKLQSTSRIQPATAPEIRKKRPKRASSPSWMSSSRLEKKGSGDSKRLVPEQRRKKLKPK